MRIKSGPSTAQRLALFREELSQHYRCLRSDKCKKVPKPSVSQFEGFPKAMAERIEQEELQRHESALWEIEKTRRLNTP